MTIRRTRIFPLVLSLACAAMFAVPACASESGSTGSISVTMRESDGTAIGGGSLSLYKVADSDGGSFSYIGDFEGCGDDLLTEEELAKAGTAEYIAAWAVESHTEADSRSEIDDSGSAEFTGLSRGLYMVVQDEAPEGYEAIKAFLVTVPVYEDGEWAWDVDASPKTGALTEPGPPQDITGEVSDDTDDTSDIDDVDDVSDTGDTSDTGDVGKTGSTGKVKTGDAMPVAGLSLVCAAAAGACVVAGTRRRAR